MKYNSVTEINEIIKNLLEKNEILRDVEVSGEVSNLKHHSRGHLYFSLKDETSKINAVFFNSENRIDFDLKDGNKVIVRGKIGVYSATGSYQIIVTSIKHDGVGNLNELFEELKRKLNSEGLFDSLHKKKIPRFPEKIGVITAKEGAAVKDIITTIKRRYPLAEIYLFPSLVQGEDAKHNIVRMIEKANKTDMDVLIVGRGGGSLEDLWAFNEEMVARAIYDSKIPIISAVGHEIDYTIADFVADLRAPTPTAAAELAVKNIIDIEEYLSEVVNRMDKALLNKINHSKEKIERYKNNYILKNPLKMYDIKFNKLKIIKNEICNVMDNKILKADNYLNNIKLKLELLNPINILEKGYSIVKKDNKIVKDIKGININDEINIVLSNGEFISKVEGIK